MTPCAHMCRFCTQLSRNDVLSTQSERSSAHQILRSNHSVPAIVPPLPRMQLQANMNTSRKKTQLRFSLKFRQGFTACEMTQNPIQIRSRAVMQLDTSHKEAYGLTSKVGSSFAMSNAASCSI